MKDARSLNALLVADRHAHGDAFDSELASAWDAAWASAWAARDAVWAARDAAMDEWAAACAAQSVQFRKIVEDK
jgi:hypothetical protein